MKKLICFFFMLILSFSFCACNGNSHQEEESTTNAAVATASTTEKMSETSVETTSETEKDYILNTNSMKFHYPSCYAAEKISDKNRKEFHGTRTSAIAQGYDACGICNP